MGSVGIAGFGDRDLVAGPGGAALVAVAGVETGSGGRQVGDLAPSDDVILDDALMHPGPPQSLDDRQAPRGGAPAVTTDLTTPGTVNA
jgi:hypothetical protein